VLTLALDWREHPQSFPSSIDCLLRPLPFPNGEQLVVLHENRSGFRGWMCRPQLLDWQRDSRSSNLLARDEQVFLDFDW